MRNSPANPTKQSNPALNSFQSAVFIQASRQNELESAVELNGAGWIGEFALIN